MRGDWKDYRPAIWLGMLGVAVMLVIAPFYLGAVLLGAAIGAAIRITQRRRRFADAEAKKAASTPRHKRS
jgi:hypothetical protein